MIIAAILGVIATFGVWKSAECITDPSSRVAVLMECENTGNYMANLNYNVWCEEAKKHGKKCRMKEISVQKVFDCEGDRLKPYCWDCSASMRPFLNRGWGGDCAVEKRK